MADSPLTYARFRSDFEARELIDLLNAHQIPFEVDDYSAGVSSFIIGDNMSAPYGIKIAPTDFEKVNSLMALQAGTEAEQIGRDYYLFGFTDDELFDILREPDKWSPLDIALSKKILAERGCEVSPAIENSLKADRVIQQTKRESDGFIWIVLGYLGSVGGGIPGLIIAIHLLNYRHTLPDGTRLYAYTKFARMQGVIMIIISLTVSVFLLYSRLKKADA